MAEHSQLVAEMGYVERLQLSERLRHAKKRRLQQLKGYAQREKQLTKTEIFPVKKIFKRPSREVSVDETERVREKCQRKRLLFADNIVLLDAVARNDSEEGMLALLCDNFEQMPIKFHFEFYLDSVSASS